MMYHENGKKERNLVKSPRRRSGVHSAEERAKLNFVDDCAGTVGRFHHQPSRRHLHIQWPGSSSPSLTATARIPAGTRSLRLSTFEETLVSIIKALLPSLLIPFSLSAPHPSLSCYLPVPLIRWFCRRRSDLDFDFTIGS